MKFLSVCSGIEAASVAWHSLGWESVAYSEIEPFPCKVLQHHYPDVPNLGDMTKFKEWPDADVDVFVGGTPCQSFSVAGLRKGLDDPRGNLMLTFLAIAKRYRPNWLVWENVPGVLSSADGRDFGSFLGGLAILGYGFAYRVLDAQYFGVAQRRRRVFVVGYLGDWRPAAAVLFERHSLQGHPAPSREKGKGITTAVREGAAISDYDVAGTLDKGTPGRGIGHNGNYDSQVVSMPMVPVMHSDVCPALKARDHKGPSSDGDGDGAILVPMQPIPLNSMNVFRGVDADASTGCGIGEAGEAMFTISKAHSHAVAQPIALAENTIGRKPENGGNGDGFTENGPMYTLNATGVHGVAQPIAFRGQMSNPQTDVDMTQT
jgi:DNA (cytosine-5)-methyltransferase 1